MLNTHDLAYFSYLSALLLWDSGPQNLCKVETRLYVLREGDGPWAGTTGGRIWAGEIWGCVGSVPTLSAMDWVSQLPRPSCPF
jgi:hypothetical protein